MKEFGNGWRLLLIDDDEDDFIIVKDLLRQANHQSVLQWCNSYAQGMQALLGQEHDLCLVDYRLGSESGLTLIKEAMTAGVTTPIILLTGQGDAQLDANAIEYGAADYLVKGQFDSHQLQRSIRYAIDRGLAISRLAESETRYRLLFDSNPEPMWVVAKQIPRFLAVNRAALQLFGYEQDEFLALRGADIYCDAQGSALHFVPPFFNSSDVGVATFSHKNGNQVYAKVVVHDFEFANQSCYLVLAIDVTEKRKAREEARQREQAFRKLLSDTRDALLVIAADGRVCFANRAAQQLFRLSQEQLLGHSFELGEQQETLFEWSLTMPTGQFEVEVHSSETDWEGARARLLSLRDIADRKESQKQLRLLKRSLEASYNGVIIVDARAVDFPIIYVSPSFERITGYRAEEVLGRNCRFLQGEERDPLQVEDIRRGLAQARDVRTVVRNFRKDGTLFWNELFISPIINEQGVITHFVGIQNDITEQRRYENELSYNASHDVLTGLPNRALLEDRLGQGCKFAVRYQRSLAVMFIDLDGFKPINETIGHQFGDLVLVEVAKRMSEQVRPGDTVARMGGDEFIVLLPDLARSEDVVPIAERLINSISRPYRIQSIELHVTASIGITLSDGHVAQPTQLIQQADMAMYKAKQEGRNNFQWYTKDLDLRVSERVNLRNEIQKAIESEAFELYYQPQIEGRSGKIVGLEALLRWKHPERGFISPASFIPVAEDTGQIIPLSMWVLNTACEHIGKLNGQGINAVVVAVNISSVHFQKSNFVESVQQVLAKHGLSAKLLELEITETVLLDNANRAIETLHQLKKLGVRLAIDDFGTGFSSLNYLKRLPIDKVKIDRSFVKEVISDRHDAAITQGIISIAHLLQLKVVAEGVETEPQLAFLKKSHCDEFQGFYFAKPMPFQEIKSFLNQHMQTQAQALWGQDKSEEQSQTVLLLDDEENILRALARVLRRDGYKILMASRAQDAFELLAKNDVQVILSDQRMPEMNGTEFLSRVKVLYPNTIRIVLSGYTDLKSVTDAINQGAIYKFLTKPWDDDQLRQTVSKAFRDNQERNPEVSG
ncbi:MAG: EAL domain-containing protein [Pseudomonas sp.]|uniref:EAL domain-containing protein n=1 Tax=Pseudomonas sp. TaxID=306 RepID=UPI003D6E1676